METWFLNHVLGLSLSVLLLGLPGPLGAGTPSNNSTDSVTAGFHSSTATDELGDTDNNATSTSSSSETLSPSQRNILLTHTAETHTAAAGSSDTEQTQTFTETSSRSLEAVSLSTEPLISTLVVATTEAATTSSSSTSSTSGISGDSSSSTRGTSAGSSGTSSISGGSSSSTSGGSSSTSSISGGSSSSTSGGSSSTSSISGGSSSSTSGGSSSTSSISGGSSSSTSGGSSSTSSISGGSSSSSSSSTSSSSSSTSRDWKNFVQTDQGSDASPAVSWEATSSMLTEKDKTPQDSTTLRQGDASSSMSHTAVLTDSTYTSTTITRAGERKMLSVTSSSSNSTSSAFTEDSSSHPSTLGFSAGATETEDYTHSAPSTRTDSGDTTDRHMTHSFSETGSPEVSSGTQSINRQPNVTQHHHTSTSGETPDSTPPLRVTEPSTDQSEASVSSTPPVTSPAEGPANASGTEQESGSSLGTSTESSTGVHSSSTQNQQGTEGVSSQTSEQSGGFGLTTGPPTVSSSTPELDHSLTVTPVLVHDVFLTTTPVAVTESPHITEENTSKATASTTTTTTTTTTPSPVPATSSPRFSSTISGSVPESPTDATVSYTMPPTMASTLALRTSATPPTRRESPSQTQGPSTGMADPTKVTTLQIETSTGTLGVTTAQSQHITTTYTHSTPTESTEALQTTGKQADGGTTELVVTTTPADVRSTTAPPPLAPPRDPCVSNPCMNGGVCASDEGHRYTCHCQQAWTGPNCSHDVDECEKDPCPVGSRCVNTRGSFSCECPLGFDLEDGRTCTRAKTFLGTFTVNRLPHDPVVFKSTTMHEIQREIIKLLNASLSVLQGYSRSVLSNKGEDGVRISAVNMFSTSADVTSADVYNSIQTFLSNCSSSLAHCRTALHHQLTYHVESLCAAQKTQCDTERSTCSDSSGTAQCQCLQGYYKHNPDDLSCLECGDGYKLENGTCVQCMFGFGGFQCGNFYKLIAVVVSPAGGALLLILIIALIVTCCKKDKNDINKIIFKSGDLQMSPYADFPKSNRISMEWGRETIEMQENGSTKNLLQMTDIYYSPALRNSDLERNGLYPFTGLPGSRHSCIYPAQWNPSFISDDSRRRDYF